MFSAVLFPGIKDTSRGIASRFPKVEGFSPIKGLITFACACYTDVLS